MSEPVSGAHQPTRGHGFGTAPVFLASISMILGAVMFLRFGYAVGHTGLLGALLIIILGHAVTVPTALAIAEIATNRRVEGGGEYFIISRSFGITIGGAIGMSLYLSQAISVAFYLIAFAEAFQPLAGWFETTLGRPFDPRIVSLPATVALVTVVIKKGADLGVKALWVVASILGVSLAVFFLGSAPEEIRPAAIGLTTNLTDPDAFMLVFAIVFPARPTKPVQSFPTARRIVSARPSPRVPRPWRPAPPRRPRAGGTPNRVGSRRHHGGAGSRTRRRGSPCGRR